MTDQQPGGAPRPNHSTGPKTPEGKVRCRLNAYRHGLAGQTSFPLFDQLCVFTPEEQQAYEKHCKIVLDFHNLQLLTVYEHRIYRAMDKNRAQLKAMQAERKAEAKEAMRQAKMLYRLAEAEGKPYQPEAHSIAAPEVRESVFSTPEVARELSRAKPIDDAENHHSLPQTSQKSRAQTAP